MPPNKAQRACCVSIHDVSPATWPQCVRLIEAMQEVAPVPLTLLVVPRFHRQKAASPDSEFTAALNDRVSHGDELALHGFYHLDDAPAPRTLRDYLLRRVYTAGEGEFAALTTDEAARRIALGVRWFAEHGWRPEGFVAPAWLMSDAAWPALDSFPLRYTTTLRHFHLLPENVSIPSPVLTYSARSAWRRSVSKLQAALRVGRLESASMVRLGLHPADATHPDLILQAQALLECLLKYRTAMTKAAYAQDLAIPASNAMPERNPALIETARG